jgi:tetratricopeptide (TPR) repeat protein
MSSAVEIETICTKAKQYFRRGEMEQAIELFNQVFEIHPDSLKAHQGIATAYFVSKQYKEAAEHFKRASHIDPRQGKTLINLGAVYNRTGEYQKAIEVLRSGLRKERNSSEGYYNLGYAQRKLGQPGMAVTAYREAIRLNPKMIDAHQNLANIFLGMGNYRQAKTEFHNALKMDPNFERAKTGLKKCEQTEAKAKQELNPFGKLVESQGVHVEEAPRLERTLSEEERALNRKTVHSLAHGMEQSAKDFLSFFQDEFEPALVTIKRAAIEAADHPEALREAHEAFREMIRLKKEYRRNFKEMLDELREHEDAISSPQVTTSE